MVHLNILANLKKKKTVEMAFQNNFSDKRIFPRFNFFHLEKKEKFYFGTPCTRTQHTCVYPRAYMHKLFCILTNAVPPQFYAHHIPSSPSLLYPTFALIPNLQSHLSLSIAF